MNYVAYIYMTFGKLLGALAHLIGPNGLEEISEKVQSDIEIADVSKTNFIYWWPYFLKLDMEGETESRNQR